MYEDKTRLFADPRFVRGAFVSLPGVLFANIAQYFSFWWALLCVLIATLFFFVTARCWDDGDDRVGSLRLFFIAFGVALVGWLIAYIC